MMEALEKISKEAFETARATTDDHKRVALEHVQKTAEYWQQQYALRQKLLKGIM
jgi:hypothetical protein